jgi:hypothetical protein
MPAGGYFARLMMPGFAAKFRQAGQQSGHGGETGETTEVESLTTRRSHDYDG